MKPLSILLVEDNRDDEEFALLALHDASGAVTIDVARDGEAALRYLTALNAADAPAPPALIVLDLRLPKVDGFEVLRRIRATVVTRFVPTVVLSSSDAPDDVKRCYELGVNSYVRKPIEFSQYIETVRQVGRYWLAVNSRA